MGVVLIKRKYQKMNIMEKASKFIKSQEQKSLATTIDYNGEIVKATVGKTIFKVDNAFGSAYIQSTDFLIAVDAISEQPKKGDKIFMGETEYQVLAPQGQNVWRFSDFSKTIYRVHSKRIG